MELPSVLRKNLGLKKTNPNDRLQLPFDGWLRLFFAHALEKNKDFYWAWKDFMIVVRKKKDHKRIMVLEVPLPQPPFLAQKHIDITNIPPAVLTDSLMFIYHHYKSSPLLRRNREHSVGFLSFVSFVSMIVNNDIKKLNVSVPETKRINRLLVAYLMKTLDFYDIQVSITGQKQHKKTYSVSQLQDKLGLKE